MRLEPPPDEVSALSADEPRIGLLDLPKEVLIQILAMLPTLHDLVHLRSVCKFFGGCRPLGEICGAGAVLPQGDGRTLLECALEQRLELLGLSASATHPAQKKRVHDHPIVKRRRLLAPRLALQWAKDLQPLEAKGFLAPGKYQLLTAARDRAHSYSYTARGTITLCAPTGDEFSGSGGVGIVVGGVCTGSATESSRPIPQDEEEPNGDGGGEPDITLSRIQNGRWTLNSIQFHYIYGHHLYYYDLHLVSVTCTCLLPQLQPPPPGRRQRHHPNGPSMAVSRPSCGLPTAHLQGTWGSTHPISDPVREHGTVDQMLLVGHGLGVSRQILTEATCKMQY